MNPATWVIIGLVGGWAAKALKGFFFAGKEVATYERRLQAVENDLKTRASARDVEGWQSDLRDLKAHYATSHEVESLKENLDEMREGVIVDRDLLREDLKSTNSLLAKVKSALEIYMGKTIGNNGGIDYRNRTQGDKSGG